MAYAPPMAHATDVQTGTQSPAAAIGAVMKRCDDAHRGTLTFVWRTTRHIEAITQDGYVVYKIELMEVLS